MTEQPQQSADPRNGPCPCGSGKVFRHCCERTAFSDSETDGKRRIKPYGMLLVGIVVGAVGMWGISGLMATPEPWAYDEVHDRHWDPDHGHWHDGPPPPHVTAEGAPSGPGQPAAPHGAAGPPAPPQHGNHATELSEGDTPPPWFYDEANNRHWDPNHGHWHGGRPPPENLR